VSFAFALAKISVFFFVSHQRDVIYYALPVLLALIGLGQLLLIVLRIFKISDHYEIDEKSPLLINSVQSEKKIEDPSLEWRPPPVIEVPPEVVRIIPTDNEQVNEQATFPMPNIPRLLRYLIDSEGSLPLASHTSLLKTYPNSFTGKEGVDWMLRFVKSRSNATIVLQKLLDDGYIVKLTNRNNERYIDNDDIYTLNLDKIRRDMYQEISYLSSSAPTTTPFDLTKRSQNYESTQNVPTTIQFTVGSAPTHTFVENSENSKQNPSNQTENGKSHEEHSKISASVRNFLNIMAQNLPMCDKELPTSGTTKRCFLGTVAFDIRCRIGTVQN
jgi:hypothetical protein